MTAFNQISRLSSNLHVTVQHPISHVVLRIPPVVVHTETRISLTLRGSHDFRLDLDFGDGNKTTKLSSDPCIGQAEVSSSDPNGSALFRFYVGHTYAEIGRYNVSVNVSNQISHMAISKVAVVDEPIEGIVMTTEAGPVVTVRKVVVVKATVASGNNLAFQWDFSDSVPTTVVR